MGEKEFETITVKDICDRAMVHRTTFYNHYVDKYDLLRSGMQETYEMLVAESNLADDGPSAYRLFFSHVAAHRSLYLVMLCGSGANSFQAWLRDRLTESLIKKMQQSEKEGESWSMPLPMLAYFCAGAIVGTLTWWLSNDLPCSPEQMGDHLRSLLSNTNAPQALR